MAIFDVSGMDDGGASMASKKMGAKVAMGPQAAKAQQALEQGAQPEMKQVIHNPTSKGDVVFIDGKEYQPTGDTQSRGFAVLTKTKPDLQSAIAAKGGKHSHMGDPGRSDDPNRYHEQDRQLDMAIKEKGGTPQPEHSRYIDKNSDGIDDNTGAVISNGKATYTRDQMIDQVMERKNVDRPVAERVVNRAMRG